MMYNADYQGWLKSTQVLTGNQLGFDLQVIDHASSLATDFHKEIDKAVCHIANTYPKRLFLAFSGGMDSEYVANALLRNKIEFTPLLLDIGRHNVDELWYAEHWCRTNNIEPYRISADPAKLLSFIEQYCVPKYLTVNLGGYINVFLADYVKKAHDGVLVTGCGDPTVNPAGIYTHDKVIDDPTFYYWDIDVLLNVLRPGEHPRSVISYFPDTLHSYVYNYDTQLTEQEAKAKMYGITIRPKIDVFEKVPRWIEYMSGMNRYIQTVNYKIGNKQQFLKWLTGESK